MAQSDYLNFLTDPDQDTRRAELRTFIGPNADAFLRTYDKLQASANPPPGQKKRLFGFNTGFCSAAFFFGPVWFFYRKLWLWGTGLTALLVLIAFIPIPNHIGIPISLALALVARHIYLQHAIRSIAGLREPAGHIDPEQLKSAGGVSKTAGWISGTAYALIILLALFEIALAAYMSRSLPR